MKSTRKKLQIFGLALILVIVLALIIQYAQFNSILKSSKKSNITEYNKDLKERLSSVLEHSKDQVNFISHFIETVDSTEEDAERYFENLARDDNIIRSIYFGTPSEDLINSDAWIPPADYKFKERQWYVNALESEGVPVTSLYEDALDGSLIVTLSKATYDNEKNLLGVVAADIKVEDITMAVETLTNEILDYSFLIDAEGNILRRKDHECENCFSQESLEELSKEKYMEFRKNKSGMELVKIDGDSVYLFYDVMENTNWIVVSSISLQNYDNSIVGLWSMFLIALVLAMTVFFTFSYFFKKYFIDPTMNFYDDVKKIDTNYNEIYRMEYYKDDPFQDTRELANQIIENTENLIKEREKATEEIIAQNEELEASYNQLAALEQELRYQNDKNRAVNEALPDALFILNSDGEFLDIQASSEVELYILEEEYIGKNLREMLPVNVMNNAKFMLENVLKNNVVEKFEYELDGHAGIQKYEIRIAKMTEDRALAVARNITKEKKLEAQLIDLSYKDQLTKLYNKRYFERKIDQIDTSNNLPISIIMADINGLKLINDSFGHDVGDQLIKSVGETILKGCRTVDTVFRVSGDEFIIVLCNTEKGIAEKVIDRIKKLGEKSKLPKGELKSLDSVVSFGINTKYDMETNIRDVVKKAEEDMYFHKLYEGQKMRQLTIDTMIESIHQKNPKIEKLTKLAMEYAEKLGKVLHLSSHTKEVIQKTIYYQEIGRITFTDELLKKSQGFTDKELEEINKHPGVGYRILSTVNEMIEVAKYVLYHHERYDGLGYPKGLKGEKIPLESRIVSLVDFYVSILMEENFEDPGSRSIVEKLREKAGRELDPRLVGIFIKEVLKKE